MILAVAAAWALPDHEVARGAVGSGASGMAVSETAVVIATADGVAVLDRDTWTLFTGVGCDGAAGVTAEEETFYVGCADGTVDIVSLGEEGPVVTTAGFTFDGEVAGLVALDGSLFAWVEGATGASLAGVDLTTESELAGFPVIFYRDGFERLVSFGTSIVVLQGQDDITSVQAASGVALSAIEAFAGGDFVDGVAVGTTGVLLADAGNGGVARFDSGDLGYSPILTAIADQVTALGYLDEVLTISADDDILLYDAPGGLPVGELLSIDGIGAADVLTAAEGYIFLATGSDLVVVSDRPWVEITEVSATELARGASFSVTFTSDTEGPWTLTQGADVVAEGDIEAGGTATGTVTIDDSYPEGVNRFRIEVDSNSGPGHDAVDVVVNNPPAAVYVGEGGIGIGDGMLQVGFTGLDDEDLSTYIVYLSDLEFAASDHPTGGPEWTGDPDVDAPRSIAATPGADARVSFYPLENGVTYYVAVRAVDSSGLEGPMSDVQAGTPAATYSAAELSGDPGGFCGTSPSAGVWGVALAALGVFRRRGVILGALLVAPVVAAKEPTVDRPHMHVQVRGGSATLADSHIQSVFGKSGKVFHLEYGWTSRIFEVGAGVGFYQELGFLQTADGAASVEHDMLTIWPLTAGATLRLDFFDEQILVPFGRIGADYWLWRENWYVYDGSSAEDHRSGGKAGWHWGAGGMILLDPIDRATSSRLEATAGIEDTFLVVEYRQTTMPKGANQLLLSGSEITVGLKCDF